MVAPSDEKLLSEREQKLPVWVKEELVQGRRSTRFWKEKYEQCFETERSNILVLSPNYEGPSALPRYSTIRFKINEHDHIDASFHHDTLTIRAAQTVRIKPLAANTIELTHEPF